MRTDSVTCSCASAMIRMPCTCSNDLPKVAQKIIRLQFFTIALHILTEKCYINDKEFRAISAMDYQIDISRRQI